jgi:voltage-gated potassium channel Kch
MQWFAHHLLLFLPLAMAAEGSPDDGHARERAWKWWVPLVLGVAAAAFGFYGLWIYDAKYCVPADAFSVGYHTLQLFIIHAPHLDHPVPWQLNVGRWLAAALFFGAIARGLWTVFRSECRLLFAARFRRGHVVICGLGRLGMQLAQEFRRDGRVVAIEASGTPGQIATATHAGVAVIAGDACSPATLSRAAVGRASRVIAVCDDERKNIGIAATVGELLSRDAPASRADGNGLECWLFITDPWLRQTFRQDGIFPHTGKHYQVNVRGLDMFELAARQILRKVPLDYERIRDSDARTVHLVIVGFGSMGQHLALQAARIGHFANSHKLRVTIVERKGSTRRHAFLASVSKFRDVCDLLQPAEVPEGELDPDDIVRMLPRRDDTKELLTIALCWEGPKKSGGDDADFWRGLAQDDPANVSLALALARNRDSCPQVLVFQTSKGGFGALFSIDGRGSAIGPQIRAFGMLEDTLSVEELLHEREDSIAKALHENYYNKQLARGRKPGERPALFVWEQLAERFKDSNRRAADHIRVKLRAIGYRLDELRSDQPAVQSFRKDQVDLLARMEHESWCAEWWLQGYSYAKGERNDVKKTQPYLVSWNELDEDVKKWDREQVEAIPEALKLAHYGIYPQVQ